MSTNEAHNRVVAARMREAEAEIKKRERLIESLGAADVHLCTLRPEFEGLVQPSKLYGIGAAGRPTIFVGDAQGETATILRQGGCGIAIRASNRPG